jgi:hypothetical protein
MSNYTPQGDIYFLYQYYRLSDHELTVIHLKDKVLETNECFFEGYINFTFQNCQFKNKFHFGVEGDRLPEDKRGTAENTEPMPPYGNNVLSFENCIFEKFFEVQDNCIVTFKNCTFKNTIDEEYPIKFFTNVKVEFIDCFISCSIEGRYGTEVKFNNCQFIESRFSAVTITDHSSVLMTGGGKTGSEAVPGAFLSVSGNSEGAVTSLSGIIRAVGPVFEATNNSRLTVSNIEGIAGANPATITVLSGSKMICRNIRQIKNGLLKSLPVVVNGSELYMYDGELIQSGDVVFSIINSTVQCIQYKYIYGGGHPVLNISSNSNVLFKNIFKIQTFTGGYEAINIVDSNGVFEKILVITSPWDQTVLGNGTGELIFRDVDLIENTAQDAVKIIGGYRAYAYNVKEIKAIKTAVVVETNGVFEDFDGILREGQQNGMRINSDGMIRIVRLTDKIKGVENGILGENGVYDLREINIIEGDQKGINLTDCRGVIRAVKKITGISDDAVTFQGCSGPTEWIDIEEITSNNKRAMVFYNDIGTMRLVKIKTIYAPNDVAMYIDITDNILLVKDCETIKSDKNDAIYFEVTGSTTQFNGIKEILSKEKYSVGGTITSPAFVEFRDISKIESLENITINLTINGELRWRDIDLIQSLPKIAVLLTLNNGIFQSFNVKEIISDAKKAIELLLSNNSNVLINTFETISSSQDVAIQISAEQHDSIKILNGLLITSALDTFSGNCSGELLVSNIDLISSSSGSAINLSGNGESTPHIEFTEIEKITSGGNSGCVIINSNGGYSGLKEIKEIIGNGGVVLSGTGAGRAEIIECPIINSISGASALSCSDMDYCHVIYYKNRGSITVGSATSAIILVANAGIIIKHADIIGISTGGIGGSSTPAIQIENSNNLHAIIRIADVTSIDGAIFVKGSYKTEIVSVVVTKNGINVDESYRVDIYGCSVTGTLSLSDSKVSIEKTTFNNNTTLSGVSLAAIKTIFSGDVIAINSAIQLMQSTISGDFRADADTGIIGVGGNLTEPIGLGSAILCNAGVTPDISSTLANLISLQGDVVGLISLFGASYINMNGPIQNRGSMTLITDTAPSILHNE